MPSCYRAASYRRWCTMGFWLFVIISIGSIPLAGAMARERNRPSGKWLWIAAAVGPLAPLALLILGNAKRPASVS